MDSEHDDGNGGGNEWTVKPGRVNGKNSKYRSGTHPIKPHVRSEIHKIFTEHIMKGSKGGRVVGGESIEKRKTVILGFFSDLFYLGYKIESVHNLKQKHLVGVFNFLEKEGQAPATLQNKISIMRMFCEWIGKPGMVGSSEDYVLNPLSTARTMVAQEDKSWDGKGIDVMEKIEQVRKSDERVAGVLMMCYGFGLRRKEAILTNLFKAVDGNTLFLVNGTKGGRARSVPIEYDWQWALLEEVKSMVDQKTGKLIQRGKTLKQSLNQLEYRLRKHGLFLAGDGVTAHGLRHQYMQERFIEQMGVAAPVKGGDISSLDRSEFKYKTLMLMERAGHSRTQIGASYYGSRRMKKKST